MVLSIFADGLRIVLPEGGPWVTVLGYIAGFTAAGIPLSLASWWSRHHLKAKAPGLDLALNTACVGIISLYAPYKLADLVGIQSGRKWLVYHYMVHCSALLTAHRWLAVMTGRQPRGAVGSVVPYVLHLSSPLTELDYEASGAPVKPAAGDVMAKTAQLGLAIACCALSVFGLTRYPDNLLLGVYCQAALFVSIMETLFVANSMLIASVFGYQCLSNFNSPMMMSKGLNDFWGKRWNMTVHRMLKALYFQPVMDATGSRLIATCAAFVGSGLFHEAAFYLTVQAADKETSRMALKFTGWQTAFFLTSSFLCYVERLVQKNFPKLTKNLNSMPWPVAPLLTTALVLPTGFLFTVPLVEVGFVDSCVRSVIRVE